MTLQDAILAITGAIVAWYSWETRQLWFATLRQSTLQIRPFLAIEYGEDRKLWVHNIGKGVARDVQVHNVPLNQGKPGDTILTVKWKPIDFVRDGQKRELVAEGVLISGEEHARSRRARTQAERHVKSVLFDSCPPSTPAPPHAGAEPRHEGLQSRRVRSSRCSFVTTQRLPTAAACV